MNTLARAAVRCAFAGGVPPGERELRRFRRVAPVAAAGLALALLFLPDPAQAQQLQGLIQWVVTNIVRIAISAGIIFVALTLLALRFNYVFVCFLAVGGLVAANYQTIAGLFPV